MRMIPLLDRKSDIVLRAGGEPLSAVVSIDACRPEISIEARRCSWQRRTIKPERDVVRLLSVVTKGYLRQPRRTAEVAAARHVPISIIRRFRIGQDGV